MKALRDYSPQAQHHFTRFDQVDLLVRASEATADTGFMARLMMLCSLPRTNPGTQLQYKRAHGPYTLIMTAVGQTGLPFGNLSRLLLAWVCTEAVRTQFRELFLGPSLSGFMRKLGIAPVGCSRTRLSNQMKRLFNAHIQLAYEDKRVSASVNSPIASQTGFWWNERKPRMRGAMGQSDRTGREVLPRDHPPPGAVGSEHSEGPQAFFDGYRFLPVVDVSDFHIEASATAFLGRLYRQFGVDPSHASGVCTVSNFRTDCLRELKKIKIAWPGLNYATGHGVLILWPSESAIARRLQLVEELPSKHLFLAQNRSLAAGRPLGEGAARSSANAFLELLRAFFTPAVIWESLPR